MGIHIFITLWLSPVQGLKYHREASTIRKMMQSKKLCVAGCEALEQNFTAAGSLVQATVAQTHRSVLSFCTEAIGYAEVLMAVCFLSCTCVSVYNNVLMTFGMM
jgi:hypothetical protein